MKILALELSTARGSLAWTDDTAVSPEQCEWPNDRKCSSRFFENLQTTVEKFGPPHRIIVGLGPGSYAGIRIAISAAIGLSAAFDAELVGYPSVCTIATRTRDYGVIGDARRRSFFFVRVSNRTVIGDYELLNEADLKARLEQLPDDLSIFSSDLLPQFHPRVEQSYPSAEILGGLLNNTGSDFMYPPLEPIYLREANITMPKPVTREATR